MRLIGYSCVDLKSGLEYHHSFVLPMNIPHPTQKMGRFATFDTVGQVTPSDDPQYKLVERWEVTPLSIDHTRGSVSITFDGTKTTVDPNWVVTALAGIVERKKAGIKGIALDLIIANLPEWKQRNMISEGLSLLDVKMVNGVWTAGEQTSADNLKAKWAKVVVLRAHSDILEEEIDTLAVAAGTDEDRVVSISKWVDHDWPSLD